jgi:hypothetical protein
MFIPKTANFKIITAWHEKYGKKLPNYYDELLILKNPRDDWKWKVQYCKDNGIPYHLRVHKDHTLPPSQRISDIYTTSNRLITKCMAVYQDGVIKECHRDKNTPWKSMLNGDAPCIKNVCYPVCPIVLDFEALYLD